MSFDHYYSVSASEYVLDTLIGAVLLTATMVILGFLLGRSLIRGGFNGSALTFLIIVGVILGGLIGHAFAGTQEKKDNVAIVQSNIQKKYDVQSVTFDTDTERGGGESWKPSQSGPQQVVVKINDTSRIATLTQNPDTFEPTLVDVGTTHELPHKSISK